MPERYENLIAGEWIGASGGEWRERRNPANIREIVGLFPAMNQADADRALASAAKALPGWTDAGWIARSEILHSAADLFRQRADDIARDISREVGKTIGEARSEVAAAARFFDYYGGLGRTAIGTVLPDSRASVQTWAVREPVGVIVAIAPWNDPVLTPARKLAPALLSGNTVVLKPASASPISAWHVARVLYDVGLPPGVLNVVTGSVQELGSVLFDHPSIRAVTFTGSTEVGLELGRRLAGRNLRLQTEMGGKNAVVVLADADLSSAAELISNGAFAQAGQRCTATSRVIVQSSVAPELTRQLVERARSLVLGPGLEARTEMGPVVGEEQMKMILSYAKKGGQEGATIACGGNRLSGGRYDYGYFVNATVFTSVNDQMAIWTDEIFGPAISVMVVETLEQAIDAVNDSSYGLSAAIHTSDLRSASVFARRVEVGNVAVNLPTAGWDVHVPFGGFKESGSPFKEQGVGALQFYTRTKSVAMCTGAE